MDVRFKAEYHEEGRIIPITIERIESEKVTIKYKTRNGDESKDVSINDIRTPTDCNVEILRSIPFPQQLARDLDFRNASAMGLFPEIERAWVIVGNKVHLWSYSNNKNHTIEEPSDILSVCISTPKAFVFEDFVKFVVVIATSDRVSLYAVCNAQRDDGLMVTTFRHTGYTIPADDIEMVKMIGSQSGRIFMVGKDSKIYEFEYYNEASWSLSSFLFGSSERCRKRTHTREGLNLIRPLSALFGVDSIDPIVDIKIDDSRQYLYSLTQRGLLSIYSFELGLWSKKYDFNLETYAESQVGTMVGLSVVSTLESDNTNTKRLASYLVVLMQKNGKRFYVGMQNNRPQLLKEEEARSLGAVGIETDYDFLFYSNGVSIRSVQTVTVTPENENKNPPPRRFVRRFVLCSSDLPLPKFESPMDGQNQDYTSKVNNPTLKNPLPPGAQKGFFFNPFLFFWVFFLLYFFSLERLCLLMKFILYGCKYIKNTYQLYYEFITVLFSHMSYNWCPFFFLFLFI